MAAVGRESAVVAPAVAPPRPEKTRTAPIDREMAAQRLARLRLPNDTKAAAIRFSSSLEEGHEQGELP